MKSTHIVYAVIASIIVVILNNLKHLIKCEGHRLKCQSCMLRCESPCVSGNARVNFEPDLSANSRSITRARKFLAFLKSQTKKLWINL